MASNSKLYVVQLDTRNLDSNSLSGYNEATVPSDFFENLRSRSPSLTCHTSQVAAICGLNIQIYFAKHKRGLASSHRNGGESEVVARMISDPALLASNNGAATFLTTDPVTGLGEYIVCGRAYIVQDKGRTPLSKERVWGLQQMVNCAMDIYDMDPENMRAGKETLEQWAAEYKSGEWEPQFGAMGMDLYSDRAASTTDTNTTRSISSSAPPRQQKNDGPRARDEDRPLNARESLDYMVVILRKCCRKLLEALEKDLYPDEATEKIFGIEMEGPTGVSLQDLHKGQLVYLVWSELRKFIIGRREGGDRDSLAGRARAEQTMIDDMTNALMNERLGEQFQLWTQELLQSDFPLRAYSTEMARRGFDGRLYVNADSEKHRRWAVRIRQVKADARAQAATH